MTAEVITTALVAVVGLAALVAQLSRVIRDGVAGVSALSWALIATMNIGWGAHMIALGHWAVAGVNTVLGIGAISIVAMVLPRSRVLLATSVAGAVATGVAVGVPSPPPVPLIVAVAVAAPVFVALRAPADQRTASVALSAGAVALVTAQFVLPTPGAVALAVGTIAMFAPQAVTVLRLAAAGGDVSGVSVPSWVLNTLVSFVWMTWAIVAGNPAAIAANLPVGILAGVVAITVMVANRKELSASPPSRDAA